MIVALDPGKNLGLALVREDGTLARGEIILADELVVHPFQADARLVVGDGTGSARVQETLRRRGLPFEVVGEAGTTLEARSLYFRDHPPPLWMRLLPRGLWSPPRPIDDYAAYAIALRYLGRTRGA